MGRKTKIILKEQELIEIIPSSPFDFDSTFHKPDHFTSGDNYWEPGIKWQTWLWTNRKLMTNWSVHI